MLKSNEVKKKLNEVPKVLPRRSFGSSLRNVKIISVYTIYVSFHFLFILLHTCTY